MPGEEGRKVYTVAQLSDGIKDVLEGNFSGVWVEGEISNYKVYSSGHAYFTLKDEDAQIRAVMWKGYRAYLKFEPKDGDHVVVRGRLSVYEKRGEYQLVAESMEPKGLGALQAAFEKLKEKLKAEGFFDESRKKPLPYIPWSVGIITSPKGAVIRDMIRTLRRRFPGLRIVFAPVAVQGDGAAAQIARAVADMNEYGAVDVIIVGRGGGSLEDLWAFNEEVVARAVYASRIPVVSAVGHETDFTICDFVADMRASTPTAAAEQIAPEREAVERLMDDLSERLLSALRDMAEAGAQTVDDFTERLDRAMEVRLARLGDAATAASRHLGALSPRNRLANQRERVSNLDHRLAQELSRLVDKRRERFSNLERRLVAMRPESALRGHWDNVGRLEKNLLMAAMRIHEKQRSRLENLESTLETRVKSSLASGQSRFEISVGKLDAVSPLKVLQRGYSIVSATDGRIYKKVSDARVGDRVKIRLSDGEIRATVEGERKTRPKQESLF